MIFFQNLSKCGKDEVTQIYLLNAFANALMLQNSVQPRQIAKDKRYRIAYTGDDPILSNWRSYVLLSDCVKRDVASEDINSKITVGQDLLRQSQRSWKKSALDGDLRLIAWFFKIVENDHLKKKKTRFGSGELYRSINIIVKKKVRCTVFSAIRAPLQEFE